jgi:hypothetical protein
MRNVKPETVVEMLKEEGIKITIEQAKLILDFMYQLAGFAVDDFLHPDKDVFLIKKAS